MSDLKLTFENATTFIGKEIGVSSWHVVDQDKIAQFAACTGDHQWIHVDVARANRESPFGGPIAHGYLSLSMLAALSMEVGVVPADAVAAFNYGLDKVRYLTPVKAGAKVRLRATLMDFAPKDATQALAKYGCTLEIDGEPKPALIAETLAMLVSPRPFQ